ncbi:hypothetical protein B0I35DRAFT_420531, partial [Stachybotrys elegans]
MDHHARDINRESCASHAYTASLIIWTHCVMVYLFITTSQKDDIAWANTGRLIVIILWIISGTFLSVNSRTYMRRHRLEVLVSFFILWVILRRTLGLMTDEIGIIMIAIVVATFCPELRRDLAARLLGLGMENSLP